jgi:fructokinase
MTNESSQQPAAGTWPRIVCQGELLLDFVAVGSEQSIETASTFQKAPGGAPANVAVGVSRLGVSSGFIGKVSDDAFGRFLRETLVADRVDVRGLVVDPRARTPLAFVGQEPGGGLTWIFYHRGLADSTLRSDELHLELVSQARVFHFGSVGLAAEPGRSATLEAARTAADRGCIVSFDPNVRLELWDSADEARQWILDTLPLAEVLKVSGDELAFLTEIDEPGRAAAALQRAGPPVVVVTLGSAGAYIRAGSSEATVPGFEVDAVDPTGAGDAFVAGLLTRLVDGDVWPGQRPMAELVEAVRFANATAALSTTQVGAIPSLPRRDAVEALLARAGGGSAGGGSASG